MIRRIGGAGWLLACLIGALAFPVMAAADTIRVAVASNFAGPARQIAGAFTQRTGHDVIISTGSTGQLYAQIRHGAPLDVFLSADSDRPRRLIDEGLADPDSLAVYAIGRLVLYSPDPDRIMRAETLTLETIDRLAIANPATAPYGAAALDVLDHVGALSRLEPLLVRGNNIAQAYQFVVSGNADMGLVAQSQLVGVERGSQWLVPDDLHRPIAQAGVVVSASVRRDAAKAFMSFLQGPDARVVLESYGYRTAGTPNGPGEHSSLPFE